MPKIISIASQKGGVGKTTTALNLAAGLSAAGKRVLLVDLDPQANLSEYLGFDYCDHSRTVGGLMEMSVKDEEFDVTEVIFTNSEGLEFIPASIKLSNAENFLMLEMSRETVIKSILEDPQLECYNYIIIDCLPSLGVLLVNALAASDSVIIPINSQKFALDGFQDFCTVINAVKKKINRKIQVAGILLTMVDNTNGARAVKEALEQTCGKYLYDTEIRRLVEAPNSTFTHKSLVSTPNSRLGEQYRQLAKEFLVREG